MRPEVRTQVPALYCPARRGFNPHGKLWRRPRTMTNDLDHPLLGRATRHQHPLGGVAGETRSKVHARKVNPEWTFVNPPNRLHQSANNDTGDMDDRWPQRSEFRRLLTEYRKKEHITLKEASERLGSTYATIRQYISPARKDTKPGIELLQRASELFGVSVLLFIDDPGRETGTNPQLSAVDEFMVGIIGTDLKGLTDKQKQSAFEAWRAIIRGYETKP